ncbi:ArgE/DapE family deacylase [Xylophilus sp. GOD-11R]|uniref:ArgE/DapE family deacylase n=1 Tax=Xylophilus sp. GOD-11R TaxID=3089814 RepID=UPI00298BF22F|nr:ArgE/DapE family deacylase [Xylophilus sp. GOD-11R]WPB58827.1 ArgE/DapE family deacylase [Xylophilus sp. GOD-11R]
MNDMHDPSDITTGVLADEAAIVAAAHALREQTVALLSELVTHPSLLGHEQSAQRLVADTFESMGLQVDEFQIDEEKLKQHPAYSPSIVSYDGRTNVVGIHRPSGPFKGQSLIFNGHIDVVPTGAEVLWTGSPFSGRVEGDRLYGRGASDMKAGIVAYTMAYRALKSIGLEPASPVYFQSVIEEECTGNGALACLVAGYRADAAVIPEPIAENGVMTCQMGVIWLAIEVLGKPVHASVAQTGVGAIDFALYLFGELKKLEEKWNAPSARYRSFAHHQHPVNFNLGKITGGEWASSVPSSCRADIRLGFYPDRKVTQVKQEVEALLAAAYEAHPAHAALTYRVLYEGFQADGCHVPDDAPIVTAIADSHFDVVGKKLTTTAFTGTTDCKFFNLYGETPAICYGPSGGANIHGIDEWVSIDSVMQTTAVLAVFMARWCGVNRLQAQAAQDAVPAARPALHSV